MLVSFMTDNKNRTASEVRHAFTKGNGNLGENGSVGWIFDLRGFITVPTDTTEEEVIMDAALEAGAIDVVTIEESGVFEIYTEPTDFLDIKTALLEGGFEISLQRRR